ncbi:unnamed protein product [Clonostachys rosea]|uniref:PD-(D/E)XK nuclease-like domain-containing protein n=1 Tax=Bionectria ochroleuca TaxID=29856 RepID=A0ABY6V0C1_BIOOC|nr:unnamed protein product [Clonostachys rosea]
MKPALIEAWIQQLTTPPQSPPQKRKRSYGTVTIDMGVSSPPPSTSGDSALADPDTTPRVSHQTSKRRRLDLSARPIAFDNLERDDDASSARSKSRKSASTATSDSRSRLSRSPTKNMGSLELADRPVRRVRAARKEDLPNDVAGLFFSIRDAREGRATIPREALPTVLEALTILDPSPAADAAFDQIPWSCIPSLDAQLELKCVQKIVRNTIECAEENVSEASWNSRVHEYVLDAALEPFGGIVSHWDVTRAPITKSCLPRHSSGLALESKMVDFCICLGGRETTRAVQQRLKLARETPFINHTNYQPLLYRPIAVSIETKTPNGSDEVAKTQLSVWVTGHFARLRSLSTTSNDAIAVGVTLPLLIVRGGEWSLWFARDTGDGIDLIETISVGNTNSILGCYKVLAMLRHLAEWAKSTLYPWMEKHILLDGNVAGPT